MPDNTLYTVPELASPETANGNTWLLGGNQDGLYTIGWLDVTKGPQLLTIPHPGRRRVRRGSSTGTAGCWS